MNQSDSISLSVFTKPWRGPVAELAARMGALGVAGVELPVRPGFQVEPQQAARDLPAAARLFGQHGVAIASIAATPTPELIELCAGLGIPVIRTMAPIEHGRYAESVAQHQRFYASLLPALERFGVVLGVQNHYGAYVCNAMGLRDLLAPFDTPVIGAVWDAAHNALAGEEPELALDIVWPILRMVNLKNARWQRAADHTWQPFWTTGADGLASWPRVVAELRRRQYRGTVCLTAEYTHESAVDALIAVDVAYVRDLLAESVARQSE
ncbi:MAG TPA: TIM barrel protein [Roseiflexaceae bacterium]|nr:TIM barrel protein [Roseiflexaceae bacterium]